MKSKLRFTTVFGDALKEKFDNVKPTNAILDACLVKGNSKYFGLSWYSGGGGVLALLDVNNPTRLGTTVPLLRGHNGVVQDFDFYPFNDNIVATSSDDTTVKVWNVPDVFEEDVNTCMATLNGHHKRVNLVQFNPVAESIIASASFDNTVKVWNIEDQSCAYTGTGGDSFTAVEWNYNGSLLGLANRDKKIRIADPRANSFVSEFQGHEGPKIPKVCWLGNTGYLFSTGFAKSYDRQFFLWDLKKLTEPVQSVNVDNMAGSLYPFFDGDTNMLYLAGKGDGNIRYYEYLDGQIHYLNQFSSTVAQKGIGFIPKRCVDTKKNELARCTKLTNNGTLEFVSFRALRKSELFQEDLYPDCLAEEPAVNAKDWLSGKTADPKRRTLKPDGYTKGSGSAITVTEKKTDDTKTSTPKEEAKTSDSGSELAAAKAEIARLTEENAVLTQQNTGLGEELRQSQGVIAGLQASSEKVNELERALEASRQENASLRNKAADTEEKLNNLQRQLEESQAKIKELSDQIASSSSA